MRETALQTGVSQSRQSRAEAGLSGLQPSDVILLADLFDQVIEWRTHYGEQVPTFESLAGSVDVHEHFNEEDDEIDDTSAHTDGDDVLPLAYWWGALDMANANLARVLEDQRELARRMEKAARRQARGRNPGPGPILPAEERAALDAAIAAQSARDAGSAGNEGSAVG